jgi:TldD protein
MGFSRRDFLKASTGAAVLAATPRWLAARPSHGAPLAPPITDPDVKPLALRALDAARSAGAAYADVRLTHTYTRSIEPYHRTVEDAEEMAVGVRALVNGYWGFASGPYWTPDEMARLGREAVAHAKANALGEARIVELGKIPVIADGHWETPVEIDPFTVPIDEVLDYLRGVMIYTAATYSGVSAQTGCDFYRQEKAFASTEGTFLTQTLRRTGGGFGIDYDNEKYRTDDRLPTSIASPLLGRAGRGWEYIREAPLREEIPILMARLEEDWRLPFKPIEAGRYDVVLDAYGVSMLLASTIGAATELDRALGYEANAGGTSWLKDPLTMLGTEPIGAPLLTVTGDRSTPGAIATVKWDDEGVEPEPFTLVKDGVLADFQTTREGAGWLAPYYTKHGKPVRSHGCANAPSALHATMEHPPNIAIAPGRSDVGLGELIAGIEKGILITGLTVDTDFQHLNGESRSGRFYEIKRGKRVAHLTGAGMLFRAPGLWKSLAALGGPKSLEWRSATMPKGEPARDSAFSIGAVPARFKEVTIIDRTRKA